MVIISDSRPWYKSEKRNKKRKKSNFLKKQTKGSQEKQQRVCEPIIKKKKRERIKETHFLVRYPTSVAPLCAHYMAVRYHLFSTVCLRDGERILGAGGVRQIASTASQGTSVSGRGNIKPTSIHRASHSAVSAPRPPSGASLQDELLQVLCTVYPGAARSRTEESDVHANTQKLPFLCRIQVRSDSTPTKHFGSK